MTGWRKLAGASQFAAAVREYCVDPAAYEPPVPAARPLTELSA